MKKVLLIKWGGITTWGGITVVLLNLLQHMERQELQLDLYVFGKITSQEIYDRFSALGVRIIAGGHNGYDSHAIAKDLNNLLRQTHYDAVHCNTGSLELTAVAMRAARRHRVPVRIAHSHNARQNELPYAKRERLWQLLNRRLSTARLACSEQAAEHLFGKSGAKRCLVLKNGIVPADYRFNEAVRLRVRRELGLENALLIGHVGRLEKQKNHAFLLRVFARIKQQRKDAVLLLIGDGSLTDGIKEQAKQLGIFESVRFLGTTNRVSDYLQAMDVFVLPSLFEGLGIVAIEAQAADLPSVCADTVPPEAKITERFVSLPLRQSEQEWCDVILAQAEHASARRDRTAELRAAGYDIAQSAARLQQLYLTEGEKP